MSDNTGIEWTDATWNPIVGCSRASVGCDNCYAEQMARRLRAMGMRGYEDVIGPHGKWTGRPAFVEGELEKPLRWRKPRRIFVCSMSDIGHEKVKQAWREQIYAVMRKATQHTYIFLTKRPGTWLYEDIPLGTWIGVTAEDQEHYDKRWLALTSFLTLTRGMIRFISVEPMLGPVELHEKYGKPDWVIAGPETGTRARYFKDLWLERLGMQCTKHGVPFFDKRKYLKHVVREWPEAKGYEP